MKECNLPTRDECFDLMRRYEVPSHIFEHNAAVARLGVFLAHKLREKGVTVDAELVDRACLLHDMLRIIDVEPSNYDRFQADPTELQKARWRQLRARYKPLHHEDAACELLKEKYPVLATTIRKHKYTALLDEKDGPRTWEEKLVYYADKRIMQGRIVALATRLEEAHKRNVHVHGSAAKSKPNTAKVDPLIFELEKEIFERIGVTAADVTDEVVESYLNEVVD